MNQDRVKRLSDAQKACLRLVASGREAKEIARELDISLSAVNERLRAAREALGVSRSRDAARLLLESEAGADHKPFVVKPFVVGDQTLDRRTIDLPGQSQADPPGTRQVEVHETQAGFTPASFFTPAVTLVPDRASEELRNGLSAPERLGKVVDAATKLALVVCLAFLLAVLVSMVTSRS